MASIAALRDVLVVDDDSDIRQTLRTIVEEAGYTVYEAPDGMTALRRLRTHPRGMVVLLDWSMPRMDGMAVLAALAADVPSATRNAYILLTAYAGARTVPLALARTLAQLRVETMGKPFDLDQLLAAVRRAATSLTEDTG